MQNRQAQQEREPRVEGLIITAAASDIQQLLAKLKSAVEQLSQIGVDSRDLVDKAISVAFNLGAVLKEVESDNRIRVEVRRKEYRNDDVYDYTINVKIKGDYNVEVEMDRYWGGYRARLGIDRN